jgi:hyperosmotically inducible periplasmic protein
MPSGPKLAVFGCTEMEEEMKFIKSACGLTWVCATLLLNSAMATTADNTKVNERDRLPNELTADQQSNNKSDMEITRQIRQSLMKDKDLSLSAKNIKVITVNGEVTLKGPVRSTEEANRIMRMAGAATGGARIVNEMEVLQQ